jgi:predicted RecA/RadA family phage recombinase
MQRCFAYLAALGVAVLLACPGSASAATPTGAVVSNGTVQLGVTKWGDLNYNCVAAADTGCPAASAAGSTNQVGVRYVPLNTDATGDGCACEGWGVADATSGLTGYANESAGNLHITAVGTIATATTAVVTTDVSDVAIPGYALRVVHDYHPSPISPNLYEVTVTITNTGTQPVTDLRYRRVMDWDIEPTAFSEWVTIANTAASRQLLFDSDNGFATSNPIGLRGYRQSQSACGTAYTGLCNFTDLGTGGQYPAVTTAADHGALFDFGFGALAVGASHTFQTYYGAAPSEAAALSAISAQGIGVYSLGESDCGSNGHVTGLCSGLAPFDGVAAGLPDTFTFGFLTADADLSVTVGAAPATVLTGSQAAASYTVTNNGPDATPGASLTIALPPGVGFASAVPSQGSCIYSSPNVVCSFGALANGASASVVLEVTLAKAGSYALLATSSSPGNDAAAGNNAGTITLTASDVIVTVIPPSAAGPFMVQVQFRLPKSCATPCKTGAQLMLRDGKTMLGSRSGLLLKGGGHVRFNVTIDKAALQAAVGVVDHKGYRTTQTRMVVRTLGKSGTWSSVVKLGRIAVAVGRIASGGLPKVVGKVF